MNPLDHFYRVATNPTQIWASRRAEYVTPGSDPGAGNYDDWHTQTDPSTGLPYEPTDIGTEALLWVEIEKIAKDSAKSGSGFGGLAPASHTIGTDLDLSNPLPKSIDITTTTIGLTVKFPKMNTPISMPIGEPIKIRCNVASTHPFRVVDFADSAILDTGLIYPGEVFELANTSFASQAGEFEYDMRLSGNGEAFGLRRGQGGIADIIVSAEGAIMCYTSAAGGWGTLNPVAANRLLTDHGPGLDPAYTTEISSDTTLGGATPSATKVPNEIAVAGAIAAAVTGLWDDRGGYNASVNAFPSSGGSGTAGAILKGDIWTVTTGGTLPGSQVVKSGDTVRALVDAPGTTVGNWAIAESNVAAPETFVVGPASVTDDLPAIFDGTTGKLVKSKTYSAFKTLLALVKGDVGLGNVDNTADTAKPVSTAQQTALDLKANATLLRGLIDGLVTSNNVATPNTKLDVAAGIARDDTNAFNITFAASKTIDCGTTGADGLDAGSLANSTWYHVYAIAKADGTMASLASTSVSAPTMPSGYIYKRRIGSFKTDGSAHILAFVQIGNEFYWGTPVNDVNATNPGTAAVTRTLTVPTGVKVRALVSIIGQSNVGASEPGGIYLSDLSVADVAAGVTATVSAFIGLPANNTILNGATGNVWTNTSAQVRSRIQFSNATTIIYITTLGWLDPRGKDS